MNVEQRYLEVVKRKETITSLELLEQINFFRKQEENKTELRHDTLLGIIRDEFEEEISLQKILESTYKNDRGREYPMFILGLNQSKQVLMRESKFVRKAVINYIEKLELELQKPLTTEDLIILQAESIKDVKGRVEVLEDKINNQMTIDYGNQRRLQIDISKRVYERADTVPKFVTEKGDFSKKNVKVIKLLFSAIYRDVKNKFGVTSYKDVRVSDYEDCLNFVKVWREDQSVRDKINEL
ncbi:ORF6C domain-containing protein [Cetobacterium sp.]|uniref:ORF6C domain-containing protein n=1 Tax=Cetobacterium sp. TaxID=2071632 RepID=UPI003F3068DA